jgi:hypothetical protein
VAKEESTDRTDGMPLAIAAATVAACATSLLAGFIDTLRFLHSPKDFLDPSFYGATFYVGAIAATVAALVCPLLFIVIGLPLHALALRRRWTSVWAYEAVGFAVSCVAAIVALFAFPLDRAFAVPLTVLGGAIATLAFWIVARPDKQAS